MENKKAIADAIEYAIANPTARPEALRPAFDKLLGARDAYERVSKAIAQAQQGLDQLYSAREKALGAGEALFELISDGMPIITPPPQAPDAETAQ